MAYTNCQINFKLLLFLDRTDAMPRPRPIIRTVENDIEIKDDPMGEEYSPPRPTLHNRKASLQLKIIAHNDAVENRSGSSRRYSNNNLV